jgi:mono/diheme cytochrome c family protein
VRKIIVGLLAMGLMGFGLGGLRLLAANEDSTSNAPTATATSPLELVRSTPKGELKNPYNADISAVAEEGRRLFLSNNCFACHGKSGGGGMCPPLINDVWAYSPGDDTLFRLITLGTDTLHEAGYNRVEYEVPMGPMPPFGAIIKTSDDLWKMIAFIRSINPQSLKKADEPYVLVPYSPDN